MPDAAIEIPASMLATEVRQARQLIAYAGISLHYAQEADGHRRARSNAAEASDALHAAAKLAPEPHCTSLFRLSIRLRDALRPIGHPDAGLLQDVSDKAEAIRKAMEAGS